MLQFKKDPDSSLYKFYGMKSDLNKILAAFDYKEIENKSSATWRTTILQDGRAQLLPANLSSKNKVPDVTGLGLKDAVYMLENAGLKVSTAGKGKVIYQSLAQNTNFSKGQPIKIELN